MILKLKTERLSEKQIPAGSPPLFETHKETFYEGDRIEVEADNVMFEESGHKPPFTKFGYKITVSNKDEAPQLIMLAAVDPEEWRYSGFLINAEGKTVGRPIRSSESMAFSI